MARVIPLTTIQATKVSSNQIINILLVGYAFCIPISKAGLNFFEILILLFWIFQGRWGEKVEYLKNNLLSLLIVCFITLNLISIFWATSITYALEYILKYRHFLIIFVIYTSLEQKYIKHIFSAFLASMFISEVISYGIFFELWQFKNISPQDPAPFMSHTDYSIYLAFTSIILLFRVIDLKDKISSRIIYGLFFLSVTSNLFVNGGRTGQGIFIIMIFMTFLFNYQNKLKAIFVSTLLVSIIFIVAYNISPNFHNRSNQAYTDIYNMVAKNDFRGSYATRISLWIMGTDKFFDNFFIGTGIGNDMKDLDLYAKKYGFDFDHIKGFPDHHNVFVTTAIQLGVIGLLIVILIFYSILKLKFTSKEYNTLSLIFVVTYLAWSFGGMTFHLMNSMTFFTLFAGLFNKISEIENRLLMFKDTKI